MGWCNVDMVVMVVVPDWVGIGAGAIAGWVCIVAATACCCCCCCCICILEVGTCTHCGPTPDETTVTPVGVPGC